MSQPEPYAPNRYFFDQYLLSKFFKYIGIDGMTLGADILAHNLKVNLAVRIIADIGALLFLSGFASAMQNFFEAQKKHDATPLTPIHTATSSALTDNEDLVSLAPVSVSSSRQSLFCSFRPTPISTAKYIASGFLPTTFHMLLTYNDFGESNVVAALMSLSLLAINCFAFTAAEKKYDMAHSNPARRPLLSNS